MDRVRLEELLNRYVDGSLGEPLRRELEQMLLDSPEARDAFWRFVGLHSRIRDDFQSRPGRSVAVDATPSIVLHIDADRPNGVWPSAVSWLTQTGPISYMVATLVLCAMLLSAWAYQITHNDQLADDRSFDARLDESTEAIYVGRVAGMKDCRWVNDSFGTMVGASVTLGREYELTSGLLEIAYASGAKVILEGPCRYTADSHAGGFLKQGRLVARVEEGGERRGERGGRSGGSAALAASAKPQAASPRVPSPEPRLLAASHQPLAANYLFAIRTPTAVVTDLGTEFGVEVGQDGSTTSRVFRGSVRVQVVGDKRGMVLKASESAKVEKSVAGGQPSIARLDSYVTPEFVREMPSSRTIGSASSYAELVMSFDPVAYYRMEEPGKQKKNIIADYSSGKHHGVLRLGDEYGGTPFRPGRFGDSLWLRGPEVDDRAVVSDYPKAKNDRLTVAAWVMASGRPGWAMVAANWGTPRQGMENTDNAGQFLISLYRRDGDLCARIMQRNGRWAQVREGNPFPTGVWQHVALTIDGVCMRLFRNGNEVASAQCEGLMSNPPVDALGIGCKLDETGTDALQNTNGYHYWQGRIDELAIFNKALSAEEIRNLHEAKQPSLKNHNTGTERE